MRILIGSDYFYPILPGGGERRIQQYGLKGSLMTLFEKMTLRLREAPVRCFHTKYSKARGTRSPRLPNIFGDGQARVLR